ncbi:MAG: phosphate signaling complex protein PhoU [Candidatus Omnitrophica bacterium]|nr:phosphate signaling complex protein PhoU [Candidatus Omnitrophota bacterium]
MQRHFDDELQKLKNNLLSMAALAETAIHNAVRSLEKKDRNMAEEVIKNDAHIDNFENIIEAACVSLLALRQPMAQDLRFITTAMKMNMEIEAIGDLAVNIAQRSLSLVDKPMLKPLIDIPKLSVIAQKMVKDAIDAFVNKDEALAKNVILQDPQANAIRTSVYNELIYDHIAKDGTCADRAIALMLITRDLERIADRAVSISEDVIYMIGAKIVKHHPENLEQ